MEIAPDIIHDTVQRALREDVGHGDLSTQAVVPPGTRAEATVLVKDAGVIAGLPLVEAVFAQVSSMLVVSRCVEEGRHVEAGTVIARVAGPARAILTGERVALNFVQRLSGIATLTAHYVAAVEGLPVRILDTRKTTPGLRALEKYAVAVGGGVNHRFGLYDAVMLKDNHLALLAAEGYSLSEAVQRARAAVGPLVRVEVEVESVEQAVLAVEAGADMILLDNMHPAALREAVAAVGERATLEASGGITLETVRAVAETGVHYISTGALTHSVRSLDISLDLAVSQR